MHRMISSIAGIALLVLFAAVAHGQSVRFVVDGFDGREFPGELNLPEKGNRPAPVVVMLPGTDGVDQRQGFYRSRLLPAGIGTIVVDTKSGVYTSRRNRPKMDRFIPVGYEAMRLLRQRPDVDGERIGVMGWSFGAGMALRLARQSSRQRWLRSDERGFAAYVGLYGGCTRRRGVNLSDVPILILFGTADEYADPDRCDVFRELHANVNVVYFRGAHHGFDKELVNKNPGGRTMRWNRNAAEKSREHVVEFFKKVLLSGDR